MDNQLTEKEKVYLARFEYFTKCDVCGNQTNPQPTPFEIKCFLAVKKPHIGCTGKPNIAASAKDGDDSDDSDGEDGLYEGYNSWEDHEYTEPSIQGK